MTRLAAPTRRAIPGREGFTLIELTVVLVLMAVVAVVVVPVMKGTYEAELLRSTGRNLTEALQVAYSQAVTEHALHRLRVDIKGGRYQVERYDPTEEAGFVPARTISGGQGRLDSRIELELREVPPGEEEEELAEPLRGAEMSGAANAVEFYPDGTAEAKEIVLRDREGYGMALRVSPVTARVTLTELGRSR